MKRKRYPLSAFAAVVMLSAIMLSAALTGCGNNAAAETKTTQAEAPPATLITEAETITIDNICEFRIDSINITKDPELYFPAESGKLYVEVCIAYKNLSSDLMQANKIAHGKVIYAGKYEYEAFVKSEEDDRSSLTNAATRFVDTSDTEYLHLFFTMPEEVQNTDNMIALNLTICDNPYQIIVRDGAKETVSDETDGKSADNAIATVTKGETVTTANAEFYVDYSKITDDIVPPNLGAAYNHFSADTGQVFIELCIAYKNTADKELRADKAISAKVKLADGNTYKASFFAEINDRHMFDYASAVNIIPLSTEYVHCVFPVPTEVETNGEPIEISLKIDDNSYRYSVR